MSRGGDKKTARRPLVGSVELYDRGPSPESAATARTGLEQLLSIAMLGLGGGCRMGCQARFARAIGDISSRGLWGQGIWWRGVVWSGGS